MNKSMMKEEVTKHLTENIIPFWKALRDDTYGCLLYTSPSPRDRQKSRMPSSA